MGPPWEGHGSALTALEGHLRALGHASGSATLRTWPPPQGAAWAAGASRGTVEADGPLGEVAVPGSFLPAQEGAGLCLALAAPGIDGVRGRGRLPPGEPSGARGGGWGEDTSTPP